MRIDKFLKVSRLIRRRTVANEACDGGRVTVNGKTAKPSTDIKVGDKVSIAFGNRRVTLIVNDVSEIVRKENACGMYTIIGEE